MKKTKSVLISMLFLVGMALGVAAGGRAPTPVDHDVGQYYDSVIEKGNDISQINSLSIQAGHDLQVFLPVVDLEKPTTPVLREQDYASETSMFKPPKGLIKENIHIRNCSIRQCLRDSC